MRRTHKIVIETWDFTGAEAEDLRNTIQKEINGLRKKCKLSLVNIVGEENNDADD